MKTIPFTTGELRAALQRIAFVRLTADLDEQFRTGDIVAAQYWGQGKVVLTKADGKTMVPVAHQIAGQFIVDFGGDDRVIEMHLSTHSQIPSVDPAQNTKPPTPPQYRPDWEAIEADAEAGAGMP